MFKKKLVMMACCFGLLSMSGCGSEQSTATEQVKDTESVVTPVATTEAASIEATTTKSVTTEATTVSGTDVDNGIADNSEDPEIENEGDDSYWKEWLYAARKRYGGKEWYGIALVYDADGNYKNQAADVRVNFKFFDEDEGPIADLDVTLISDGKDFGSLGLQFGSNDSWSIGLGGDWLFYSNSEHMNHKYEEEFKDTLVIRERYEGDDGSYKQMLMVRPWGTRWDDVKKKHPEWMPAGYEDWYLPQIQ